jgi:site-specific DNA-methyltransferase (adenine-specific)
MTETIYESARARIIWGDAADALTLLSRRDAQLICTDPPYGVRWASGFRSDRFAVLAGDDGSIDVPALLGAYARSVLWDGQHVYVFGYTAEQLTAPMRLAATADMVWDKCAVGMGDLSSPWGPAHERITFGRYADNDNAAVRRGGLTARLRQGSVLRVARIGARGVKRHPTEKPVPLMRQLIESSTVLGDTVLDPFAGSGSTGVAAVLEGRKFIGVELDATYAATAVERIRAAEKVVDAAEAL